MKCRHFKLALKHTSRQVRIVHIDSLRSANVPYQRVLIDTVLRAVGRGVQS